MTVQTAGERGDKLVGSTTFQSTTARGWNELTTEARNRLDGRDLSRKRRLAFEALEAQDNSLELSQVRARNKKGLFKRFWTDEEVDSVHSGRTTKIVGQEIWREELEENQRFFREQE